MFSVFKIFFALGWISFGGPAAHIGYFRRTFVERLQWLSEGDYAQIVALSQFLPGPGSSQVGFAIGYRHAGLPGAVAAFLGFTLPSIMIMFVLASISTGLSEEPAFLSAIHGLKLLAVVVVADAAWGMFNNFCKTMLPISIAVFTAMALLIIPGIFTQILILILAAIIGSLFLQSDTKPYSGESFRPFWFPLILFILLLFALPLIVPQQTLPGLFSTFFQAGSLVFGGGHVVLPLLQHIISEQISPDTFLTGYAAAQAVPGPMFTFATYIGYVMQPDSPVAGALLATAGVFLPGFLLLLGVLKHWQKLASIPKISGALNGVNAAVAGLLAAALYQPVFLSAVDNSSDFALILLGLFLQKQLKLPLVWMVALFLFAGLLLL